MSEASDAYESNMRTIRDVRNKSRVLLLLPKKMAEFYAIGGPGVGQAVVGDRFQGEGNARFPPLSPKYLLWKTGQSKELNKQQKAAFGRGSKLLKYQTGSKIDKKSGYNVPKFSAVLPILVLSGKLRAAVTARSHDIELNGDTAVVTFKNLPEYALYHHDPQKAPFPKRSPVEPNQSDVERIRSFATTWLSAQLGVRSNQPTAFGGGQARIIP